MSSQDHASTNAVHTDGVSAPGAVKDHTATEVLRRATTGSAAAALDPDAIMQRVRAEVARRRATVGGGQTQHDATSVANEGRMRWQPAASRLPDKDQYALNDFLAFDDEDFVDVAYRKLLRRPANDSGSRDYLGALRSGAIGKVEVLGSIRFSNEGRQQGVHVDGLLAPYKLHGWRRKRVIGWFVGMGMAVLRLPRLAWHLQRIEASTARESHEIGHLLNRRLTEMQAVQSRIDGGFARLCAELSQLTAEQQTRLDEQNASLAALHTRFDGQNGSFAALQAHFDEQGSEFIAQQAHLDEQDALLAALQSHVDEQNASMTELRNQVNNEQRRLRSMLERLTVFLDVNTRQAQGEGAGQEPASERQYAAFEDAFRGERGQIKLRVAHYLATLEAAGIESGDEGVILDLGSGRGEWLEVLAEHGYRGRGVDLNRGMLAASHERGHEVVEANAIDYLRTQDDASFAAVTAMHLVEHIPHAALLELLDQALRVLRPGGVLILETPNPENVLVGACMFYLDPTHRNPIPPQLLQWTVHACGFDHAVIDRLSEHRGEAALLPVLDNVAGAKQINQMVAWFTAPPDYAVIARKPVAIQSPA